MATRLAILSSEISQLVKCQKKESIESEKSWNKWNFHISICPEWLASGNTRKEVEGEVLEIWTTSPSYPSTALFIGLRISKTLKKKEIKENKVSDKENYWTGKNAGVELSYFRENEKINKRGFCIRDFFNFLSNFHSGQIST